MASNQAHHATGWAAGLIAAAIVTKAGAGGAYHLWSLVACLAGVAGGTAPDWLEVAWWTRRRRLWITHRTLTHWGVAWLGLLIYSYAALGKQTLAAPAFGFAAGGVMHLLADWPNPLGVPWVYHRHSLNWWKSGRCDFIVIAAAWLAALTISEQVWLHGSHHLQAFHHRPWTSKIRLA